MKQCRRMPNWKAPGKDGVQGYWIKNLSNFHGRIAIQMNKILLLEIIIIIIIIIIINHLMQCM